LNISRIWSVFFFKTLSHCLLSFLYIAVYSCCNSSKHSSTNSTGFNCAGNLDRHVKNISKSLHNKRRLLGNTTQTYYSVYPYTFTGETVNYGLGSECSRFNQCTEDAGCITAKLQAGYRTGNFLACIRCTTSVHPVYCYYC